MFNVDTKSSDQAVIEIQNNQIWTYGNEKRIFTKPGKNIYKSNYLLTSSSFSTKIPMKKTFQVN
jgi:hypothetical protein